ncbi:MAG TPA: PEP-CTERM sorting domain-containing protein [Nitrosospira sp.]|nr:PEP-CTERM sorting domain-containing protein [Nitrosospira sp.]
MSYASAGTLFGNFPEGTVYHDINSVGDGSLVSIDDSANFSAVNAQGDATTVMFGGHATAQATDEGLKAFASMIVSNPVLIGSNNPYVVDFQSQTINPEGVPTMFWTEGFAEITDTISLGTAGVAYIKLKLDLSGTVDGVEQGNHARDNTQSGGAYVAQREVGEDGRVGSWASLYQDGFSTGFGEPRGISAEIWTNPISVLGQQATYHLELTAHTSIDLSLWDPNTFGSSGTGDFWGIEGGVYNVTSDFSHTLKILEVQGFDINGNSINLGSATSSQGTVYNIAAVQDPTSTVPEPESLALVLTGLGIMGIFSRRRRRSS